MQVRAATIDDAPAIAAMSARVQERLTASGSLQQFGPIPPATVEAHVQAGTAHVLVDGGSPIGAVFVEPVAAPVTPGLMRELGKLELPYPAERLWWLQKLMVEPDLQGRSRGFVLLEGVKRLIAARPHATVALDCWAGNVKLREFYSRAGFHLHGEFAALGFHVAVFTWTPSIASPAAG